jgi:hypothetical protein
MMLGWNSSTGRLVRRFLIYVVAITVLAAVVQATAEAIWGATVGSVVAVASIYLITVFDLRIANPEWSMFRRILPSVLLLDLAIYFIPFAYMIVLLGGWLPTVEQPMMGFIVAVPLYFVWGVYLLLRLPQMRGGSGDDLSWLHSPNMKLQERVRRYLGAEPEQS